MDTRKPTPKNLAHHYNAIARRRGPGSVAKIVPAITTTKYDLGPGWPYAGNFPTDTIEGAAAEIDRFPIRPQSTIPFGSPDTTRFTIPKTSIGAGIIDPSKQIDLASALQYQSSSGYPSLADFVHDWAVNHQNQGRIPYAEPQTLITGGAIDGLAKCLSTFVSEGDSILVEEYMYFSAKDAMLPLGVTLVPVRLDDEGISAEDLRRILENWDESRHKKPRLMYTVTIGQNPTGVITPLSRKRDVYNLCQTHDILIFEDDPYWALQYDSHAETDSQEAFLSSLAPSYLTIDIDGRVLSLQTFTKIFAPGCRVGWIVAQPEFIEKLTYATDGTTSNPSGFAEAILAQVLMRTWGGVQGFTRWIMGLRAEYETRRNVMCEVLAGGRDLRTPAAHHSVRMFDYRVPSAGMYVWVKLNLHQHPLSQTQPGLADQDILERLWNLLVSEYGLLTIPGSSFAATPEVTSANHYLRLTFAAAPPDQVRHATKLFVEGVAAFWHGKGWDLPSQEELASHDSAQGSDPFVRMYNFHTTRKLAKLAGRRSMPYRGMNGVS